MHTHIHTHIHTYAGASPAGGAGVHVLMNKDHLPVTLDGKLVAYVHTSRAFAFVESLRMLRANEDKRLPYKIFEVCMSNVHIFAHANIRVYIHII